MVVPRSSSEATTEVWGVVFSEAHPVGGGGQTDVSLCTWTVLLPIALTPDPTAPGWVGIPGIIIGGILVLCSLDFVGPAERDNWRLAATLAPITYAASSLWLVACGIALLL